jgi:hypothetical protein
MDNPAHKQLESFCCSLVGFKMGFEGGGTDCDGGDLGYFSYVFVCLHSLFYSGYWEAGFPWAAVVVVMINHHSLSSRAYGGTRDSSGGVVAVVVAVVLSVMLLELFICDFGLFSL